MAWFYQAKIKLIQPSKEPKPKKPRAKKPKRKKRKKLIEKDGGIAKIILQLLKLMPNLLLKLEKNKKTLAKLLALATIKKTITQKIILSLRQETSCSLSNFYISDYKPGS